MNYLKTFLPYLFGNKIGKSLEVSIPKPIPWETLTFEETLMFHVLGNTINQFVDSLNLMSLSKKDLYQLFNFLVFFKSDKQEFLKLKFKNDYLYFLDAITAKALDHAELQELLDFKNNTLSIFAILKKERNVPGILVIRTADGQFLKNNRGSVWSIPILGMSGRGLSFNHSNGATPCGVYSIDSVMPEANQKYEFGKFRRLIINFIPESHNELELLGLIPQTHHHRSWWRPSVVGRTLGRHLLRIHGTGRINFNPFSSHFPFYPTSGCLATNEANLLGIKKFKDQRHLLNALMEAQGMVPIEENESKIHGLLYVVELDDSLAALHFLT